MICENDILVLEARDGIRYYMVTESPYKTELEEFQIGSSNGAEELMGQLLTICAQLL
jgi:hypothetical protein